jgi:hypothetical protein
VRNAVEAGDASSSEHEVQEITIRLNLRAREVKNIRTQKVFGDVTVFKDEFNVWEANLYEFSLAMK